MGADCTIAVFEVPMEEASRFGIMNTREDGTIYEFEEKPQEPEEQPGLDGYLRLYLEKAAGIPAEPMKPTPHSEKDFRQEHYSPPCWRQARSIVRLSL